MWSRGQAAQRYSLENGGSVNQYQLYKRFKLAVLLYTAAVRTNFIIVQK